MQSGAKRRRYLAKRGRGDNHPAARDEGSIAYTKRQKLCHNPYDPGTAEHREWNRGWRYSRHTAMTTPKGGKWVSRVHCSTVEVCICCCKYIVGDYLDFIADTGASVITNNGPGPDTLFICDNCRVGVAKQVKVLVDLFPYFKRELPGFHWPDLLALIKE